MPAWKPWPRSSEVTPETPLEKLGAELCADEGYFRTDRATPGVRRAHGHRRPAASPPGASAEHRRALHRASRATRSPSGKALLRKRDEHLERGFCHVLDHGGLRRATLRGCEKLTKRQLTGALSHNLSRLLRHLFGDRHPQTGPRRGPPSPFAPGHLALARDPRARGTCPFAFPATDTNFFHVTRPQDHTIHEWVYFNRLLSRPERFGWLRCLFVVGAYAGELVA